MTTSAFNELPTDGFIRLPAVMAAVGLARSTIYELINKGKFPAPEKLTAHAAGWRRRSVQAWLDNPTGWRLTDPTSTK